MAASGIFARSGTASANTPIGGIASSNNMTPTQLDDVDRSILAEVFLGLVTRGVDIASGSSLDLDGASTPSILHNITGTTATSAITLTAGQYRILRAVGAWPLTAGSSLIVNGSTTVNYTCTAEDRLLVEGFAAGVVRVTVITPRSLITPWVTYTPTFTGFGTAASISVWSRRVGDTLEIRGKFTAGTPTAVEARMTLGFNGTDGNVTSDATKVPSIQQAGPGTWSAAQASAAAAVVLIESNVGYVTFGYQSLGSGGLTKQNGDALISSGQVFSFNATIPISGW